MKEAIIDKEGRLTLPPQATRALGSRALELAACSGRHLLFTVPGADRVTLAGLLGEISVADLLSFFNMFRQTGILHFNLEGGEKELYIQKGEIVFAGSTFPEEDLGEVLHGLGRIDRDTLSKARQFVRPNNPLGNILVGKGFVSSRDLWLATRHQAETIIYHLFSFQQGDYAFVARELDDEEIVRLSMSTQNLIMEGLRRIDERALFMRRIESLDRVPVLVGEPGDLPATAQRLLARIRSGRLSARELLRQSAMGEFEALRLLHELVEKKVVALEETPEIVPEGECGEILAIYNAALVALYKAVTTKYPGFAHEIRLFLRDLPQPFSYILRDASLEEDGSITGGGILANLAGLEEGDKKKLLADALNELIFMECIIARRELGTAESAGLIRRVQKVASRVKGLAGRQE